MAAMGYDPQFQQRIFEMLQESQYWPEQQMRSFQRQQLAQLLTFAREQVPFYRDRLEVVFTKDGKLDWANWNKVPILKREDIMKYSEEMYPAEIPDGHGYVSDHFGTGSTGKPITTRHNSLVPLVSDAGLFRAFDWHGVNYNKVRCTIDGDDPKIGSWPEGLELGAWSPNWMANQSAGKLLQINRNASPEEIAEFLFRKSVSYLTGIPNRMHSIALASEKLSLKTKLDKIITLSEAPSDVFREDCRRIFGADIISNYSSKEVYNIAHQCKSGIHYHVNSEMVLLEVLDENDQPCANGQVGRSIVTSFFNTAQPLIRYDLGDQIIMGEACSCGRTLPVIAKIAGRTSHLFRFPGGRSVLLSLRTSFFKIIAANGWQIAQTAPLHLEVRYVPDGTPNKPDFEALTSILRLRTDQRVTVSYKLVTTLPLTAAGKFIWAVCELPPES